MRPLERCGLPYIHNGDIRECLLDHNHADDCLQANEFHDGLRRRTWLAQNEGWL